MTTPPLEIRHYFVDEAGDLSLFNKKGQVVVGRQGVSRLFMVGVAHIPDPSQAQRVLDTVRAALLADPYFKGVPSMQPSARRTAICFHAKDDPAEVRREVFKVLPTFGAKVQVSYCQKSLMAL